jgi:hypothetical protein
MGARLRAQFQHRAAGAPRPPVEAIGFDIDASWNTVPASTGTGFPVCTAHARAFGGGRPDRGAAATDRPGTRFAATPQRTRLASSGRYRSIRSRGTDAAVSAGANRT